MAVRFGWLAVLLASGAAAQAPAGQILVSAAGTVRTPPDRVTIGFGLRGEGATSDEAVTRLRDAAAAVSKGVAGLIGAAHDYHAQQFQIAQVRSKDCDAGYGQARLSTGACAITGYVATMPVTVDTPRVADAGTLVGLVGRLGGLDAAVQRFWLADEGAARARATKAALANAREEAGQIAAGDGARLGALVRVQDADYREIALEQVAGAAGAPLASPPPPPPPPPPVRIDLAPAPIETTVRVMAAYAIAR